MTDKFTIHRQKFASMYQDGHSYENICKTLRVSIQTAQDWRRKLGLPPRRREGPLSWMDERKVQGRSPREILQKIAGPIGLFPKDIELILTRFAKLKDLGYVQGRRQIQLILAAAYLYLRWEGSGRRPKSPKNFLVICKSGGFRMDRSTLQGCARLFKEAGLYPTSHLTPRQLFERLWYHLREEYRLPESVRSIALELMSIQELVGRSPEVVVAACLYLGALEKSIHLRQKELAEEFGITEVSLRNVKKVVDRSRQGQGRENRSEVALCEKLGERAEVPREPKEMTEVANPATPDTEESTANNDESEA